MHNQVTVSGRDRIGPRLKLELVGLLPFAVLTLWSVALVALRVLHARNLTFAFLVWNLFLALVPLLTSTVMRLADRRAPGWLMAALFAGWILMLPNAPYLVTDLFHLQQKPHVPLWFDLAILLSCAATGVALGFRSMGDIHDLARRRWGARGAWVLVTVLWFACAYGIYLGRFVRWNSWDVLHRPGVIAGFVLETLLSPAAHPRVIGVTLLFGGLLALAYITVRAHVAWVGAVSESPRARVDDAAP